MKKRPDKADRKAIARNKKARYRFTILDTYEAGIVLRGTEVKSLRDGRVALADSFGRFRGNELFLVNCHISTYEKAFYGNHEPTRARKLLMSRKELRKLKAKVDERGLTIVALSIYFTRGLAKVEIGVAKGKRTHDRRQDMRKRDAEREMRRVTR